MKIRLRKGLDLKLMGEIIDPQPQNITTPECAVCPDDYPGFLPKLLVKEGDSVEAGTPLLEHKDYHGFYITSPISGKIKSILRGDRRKILAVVVENDNKHISKKFDTSVDSLYLLRESGLLSQFRRRPFDVVVRPHVRPRDIFITAIDSAPLALPLYSSLPKDAVEALKQGIKLLHRLTDGKVYLSVGSDWPFGIIPGAEQCVVSGPHPCGNVGVQIANIAPINRGDVIWTLDVLTLWRIGQLMITSKVDFHVNLAVTGPEVKAPTVISTIAGASIKSILAHLINTKSEKHLRVISGNVLTGTAVSPTEGFLHFPWRQITVIAQGDDVDEFMGWLSVAPSKMSQSRALPFRKLRGRYAPDARLNGSQRAMIMSGEFDKLLPMDILPEFLFKAILSKNIEDMEALGIYEIAPEDVALCEYADTSKLPLQQIVRDGLEFLRKEVD